MAAQPSVEEIVGALKNSGYLMEQEVATELEKLGYHVRTNKAFTDSDEGKSREIDVQAFKQVLRSEDHKLTVCVEILAECKNNSNPFVFVGREKNATDNRVPPREFIFPISSYTARKPVEPNSVKVREVGPFFHLGFDAVHPPHVSKEKAVQFCRIDRKGSGWSANHGGLYDSIFFPLVKAFQARRAETRINRNGDEWKFFWFYFPIVVLSGDIFYVNSMKPPEQIEPRDYVNFKREIKTEDINGIFSVDFVRQEHLQSFEENCIRPLADRARELVENEADFVKNGLIPWTFD